MVTLDTGRPLSRWHKFPDFSSHELQTAANGTEYHITVVDVIYLQYEASSALTLLVGRQEGHPARKKYGGDGGGGHWLVQMEWRPAGWSVCLPLLISPCTKNSKSSLLAPAHPGGPGKRAVKRLWCGVVCHIICGVVCHIIGQEVCLRNDLFFV